MLYTQRPIRRNQLVSPWGIGAIVPFPDDESLMIAGLDMWRYSDNPEEMKEFLIHDERLAKRLGVRELRMPPDFREPNKFTRNAMLKIPAVRFPRWHYCPTCGTMTKLTFFSPQDRCDGYEWKHGRSCKNKKFKPRLIPERFIVVCPDGHIDDFPLMDWVHQEHPDKLSDSCRLRRTTGGVSTSLTSVRYECSCGEIRSMSGISNEKFLETLPFFRCKGSKPWLGLEEDKEHTCGNLFKVVQRGGSNVWFADIRSSIYIPVDTDAAKRRVLEVLDKYWERINGRRMNGQPDRTYIEIIAEDKCVDFSELYDAALIRMNNTGQQQEITEEVTEEEYRFAEYKVLTKNSGGDNQKFYCKNYSIDNYFSVIRPFFKSISIVPKLRETRAFVGFSRLLPDDGKTLKEKKAMLRLGNVDWLPAVEVFGEGVFFEFNNNLLGKWSASDPVKSRIATLSASYNNVLKRRNGDECELNPKYVLIHTFAHLLINQLSFECGYGSSSIRERIYCNIGEETQNMQGVLIYTASGDSEGSLGGLVRQGMPGKIEDTILDALENARWCSADPVCIESPGQGLDSCNLAACHNCALLAETCCETGNRLLDRALLIGTLSNQNIGYFNK